MSKSSELRSDSSNRPAREHRHHDVALLCHQRLEGDRARRWMDIHEQAAGAPRIAKVDGVGIYHVKVAPRQGLNLNTQVVWFPYVV
jgi:hypothetical protein